MSTIISKDIQEILLNFATINNSIVIKPGNKISTLSVNKNILAVADVPIEFEKQISIYDLSTLCSTFRSLFEEPVLLTDNESFLTITDQNNKSRKSKFYFADPDVIVQAPDKPIQLPSVDVEFTLRAADLRSLRISASAFKVPDLCVYGDGEEINLCTTDKKNDTSNTYSISVGKTNKEFCYCFKVENLKILDRDYTVKISKANVAYFESDNLKYWVALEP